VAFAIAWFTRLPEFSRKLSIYIAENGIKDPTISSALDKNDVIMLDSIKLRTVYNLFIRLSGNENQQEFVGKFSINVDSDDSLFIDLYYNEVIDSECMLLMDTVSEIEPNNSTANAQTITAGQTIEGYISTYSDTDCFKVNTANSGYLDITLTVPSSVDYDLCVYSSNGTTVLGYSTAGTGTDEYIRLSVSASSYYYIRVYPYGGSYSTTYSYKLNTNFTKSKTWYSQLNGIIGSIYYWNTYRLDKLYFPDDTEYPENYPFSLEDNNNDIMYEGCTISSAAMVLRNMNAKLDDGTDFRTGFVGDLSSDPFTVMLANNGKDGSEIVADGSHWDLPDVDSPVYTSYSNIASGFGESTNPSTISLTGDENNKTATIASYVANYPQGILVRFPNHTIVFVGDTGTGGNNARFIVCDPGTLNPARGDNVAFNQSATYVSKGYTISDATSIRLFY